MSNPDTLGTPKSAACRLCRSSPGHICAIRPRNAKRLVRRLWDGESPFKFTGYNGMLDFRVYILEGRGHLF